MGKGGVVASGRGGKGRGRGIEDEKGMRGQECSRVRSFFSAFEISGWV